MLKLVVKKILLLLLIILLIKSQVVVLLLLLLLLPSRVPILVYERRHTKSPMNVSINVNDMTNVPPLHGHGPNPYLMQPHEYGIYIVYWQEGMIP